MTVQQRTVIADYDHGDQIGPGLVMPGDHVTHVIDGDGALGHLVRIERPAPIADGLEREHHRTIREFHGNDVWRDDEGTTWVRQTQLVEAVHQALGNRFRAGRPAAKPTQTCGVCGRRYPASDARATCPVCWPGFGEYLAEPAHDVSANADTTPDVAQDGHGGADAG